MAWTTQKWINLRDTAAYVTDGSGQVVLANGVDTSLLAYPQSLSINGDTFNVGWTTGAGNDGERDKNSALDPRLAGFHFSSNSAGSPSILKVEMLGGVGQYEIRLASGVPEGGSHNPYIKIKDGTTLVATIDGSTGIANFMDATGANMTAANWPSTNAALTITFNDTSGTGGTPVLFIEIGDTAAAGVTRLNTVGIKKVVSGPNITSVSTATPREGASLTITGTAFGASQGSGDVKINGVAQTVTSWSDTSIAVTVVIGTNKFGAAYTVVVRDNALTASNSYAGITGLLPANSGLSSIDVGTPHADPDLRLESSADAVSGDQVEWENKGLLVDVFANLTFSAGPGVNDFRWRIWTSGSGYGDWMTQRTGGASGAQRLSMPLGISL